MPNYYRTIHSSKTQLAYLILLPWFLPSFLLPLFYPSFHPSLLSSLPPFLPLSLPSYLSLDACYSLLYFWVRVFKSALPSVLPLRSSFTYGVSQSKSLKVSRFLQTTLSTAQSWLYELHQNPSCPFLGVHCQSRVISAWNFLNDSQGLTMTAAKCWVGRVSQNNMRISVVQAVAEHEMLIFISHMS